jgi:hypothetical protein
MFRNPISRPTATVAVLLVLTAPAAWAGPNQKLREELAPLAKKIAQVVKQEGKESIAVGEFSGPAQFPTNYGTGIHQMLIEELTAVKKDIVRADSALSLTGSYAYLKGRTPACVQLKVTIETDTGDPIGVLSKELLGEPLVLKNIEVIAALTGRTMELPPAATADDLYERIKKDVGKPSFATDGTKIKASAKAGYAVEFLVAGKDRAPADIAGWAKVPAKKATDTKGVPFLGIERDETFVLRVTNTTDRDAAVTVAVDGLDLFTFSEVRDGQNRPKYRHYIVGPRESAIIPGWHRTNDKSDSILVTEYGKGAISSVPAAARGSVGMVTVTFAAAWTGKNAPPEEAGRRGGGNEAGFGPPVKTRLEEAKREIGVVREIVSVRYTR